MRFPAPPPPSAGLGLKPEHFRPALETEVEGLWFEVHPENYMVEGGPRLAWLAAIRDKRPLSFHGVGASLGGLDPFDPEHLLALIALIDRFEPFQVSEHATFSAHKNRYHADLLPLPRTQEAVQHLANRVDEFQTALGRRIIIENPTNYLPFACDLDEPEFLTDVARRSGCGLLMDINNIWVSANNVGIDPCAYIRSIPANLVGEIHVAGHSQDPALGAEFLIDSHDAPVSEDVWSLLALALRTWGPKPVLIERDGNIPEFNDLLVEVHNASRILTDAREVAPNAT
ncbi:DUF692 domain-containing protein [Hyphomonas johnsonii]|uniref:Uncharacterized protein n=1 Tax=Hyphomonas johnsonii MHS-2 TaxID=1280950 RepID=A0A059FS36_9PROT|nr:DUF692 domain-containing protein [Hyphomonas johnsonii]KCZ93475.1 hypothetical protein HJO_06460 [Hyphomonas johnsonii MHS-2]